MTKSLLQNLCSASRLKPLSASPSRAARGNGEDTMGATRFCAFAVLAAGLAAPAAAQPIVVPDSGDTAWVLVASALVLLMTIPGLALFYGGLRSYVF